MSIALRYLVEIIAHIHNLIFYYLNTIFGINNDKLMHFIVIGIFGIILFLLLKPIFNYLHLKNKIITLTFIYVFTLLIGLTFAIEIGQKITNTGGMEFKDIIAGLFGFLFSFIIYLIIIYSYKKIKKK